MMEDEVGRLTAIIEEADEPTAFDFCRRGALLRKVWYSGTRS